MVPNHALIILGLLYGKDDFQEAMKVVNTAGWDTDCNSGNLGCLLGIKNGLDGLDAGPDWRGPVADRLFLAAADGGRSVTDALSETYHIVNAGRALHKEAPLKPKNGARFHFDLPGSVQGFRAKSELVTPENVAEHSQDGRHRLSGCLGWDGAADVTLTRPTGGENTWEPPLVWRRAWINGLDLWEQWWPEPYRLIQNSGRGLLAQGTR
jgi:hypothetical protein